MKWFTKAAFAPTMLSKYHNNYISMHLPYYTSVPFVFSSSTCRGYFEFQTRWVTISHTPATWGPCLCTVLISAPTNSGLQLATREISAGGTDSILKCKCFILIAYALFLNFDSLTLLFVKLCFPLSVYVSLILYYKLKYISTVTVFASFLPEVAKKSEACHEEYALSCV